MTALPDVLTTIRERAPHEQGVNLKISEAILLDPAYVVDLSVKTLAERIGVSEPSIIRYCRTLGCRGFVDFKKFLAQSLVLEQKFTRPEGRLRKAGRGAAAVHAPFNRLSESVAAAIRSVSTRRSFSRIDAAVKVVLASQSIVVLGVGGSSAVLAQEAQNRLFRLGRRVVAHSDGYMQRMSAATLKKGDTLLIISSTGQPASLVESAEIARAYGASCIAIAPEKSAVARAADVVIPVEFQADIPYHQPNPVRYAQLFILDCIAERAALMLGKVAGETLRRVSAALSQIQPISADQPTGD